jgi:hypothetical protein
MIKENNKSTEISLMGPEYTQGPVAPPTAESYWTEER